MEEIKEKSRRGRKKGTGAGTRKNEVGLKRKAVEDNSNSVDLTLDRSNAKIMLEENSNLVDHTLDISNAEITKEESLERSLPRSMEEIKEKSRRGRKKGTGARTRKNEVGLKRNAVEENSNAVDPTLDRSNAEIMVEENSNLVDHTLDISNAEITKEESLERSLPRSMEEIKEKSRRGRKKGTGAGTRKNEVGLKKNGVEENSNSVDPTLDRSNAEITIEENSNSVDPALGISNAEIAVSMFDYSIENHFQAIKTISLLCGITDEESFAESEIERFSLSVTFLTEWKHHYYQPKIIRFAYETRTPQVKDAVNGVSLPPFSAATVPKMEKLSGSTQFLNSSKDFILHVGGPVWALDWCPRIHQRTEHPISCEYLAVAAHSPHSSYHKIGAPLTGRGVIQIWCLLNVYRKEEPIPLKPKKRGRKKSVTCESLDDLSSNSERRLIVKGDMGDKSSQGGYSDNINPILAAMNGENKSCDAVSQANDSCSQDVTALGSEVVREGCLGVSMGSSFLPKDVALPRVMLCLAHNGKVAWDVKWQPYNVNDSQSKHHIGYLAVLLGNGSLEVYDILLFLFLLGSEVVREGCLGVSMGSSFLPKDVALPRVMLCLAHNGKVAWDVTWQPYNVNDSQSKHHIGYLAVLLGNGSLEVWEVPSPSMIRTLYSSRCKEGTDPRFIKLTPVFRCSKIRCGARQSIPLTVEWSTSAPHELILAGCHDGTVALWKFSASGYSQDTSPLLCFTADTVPIRAVAWAPDESDAESANLIMTAGHGRLKFWDIRDPYRPLWDLNPVQRVVLSLDWLREPRCVVLSFDDGTLRILSLLKAAYDVPVTGKPFVGAQQQGLQSYYCSSFTIWSVQVSRLTGLVAYCGGDGSALRFQLTSKAVKDPSRNRAPHFICGSLTEEEDSVLTINTPLPNTPFPMKKSMNEWGDTPTSIRGFVSNMNQAMKAKHQIPALGFGDETAIVLASQNPPTSPKSKTLPRLKTCRKRKTGQSQTADETCLVGEEEQENIKDKIAGQMKAEREIFPPKIVAMHRVRWNMNKGSERWLCYGGAAGILRCQEVNL
ncbi:transducin/WD40 repeat-like superfamily protein [Tasmannia lanceolata]|uniref:transducin/WD40 repeat-like superfamily protein n=1 Tax=Tasmannia lanceolata TaxID=3420 RepID=UPI00406366BE